ncbi:hypothetical protein ACIB24_21105 [Spongisporangium articulatum]|uniref:DUF559 domain-containing protein n=1 Tax=Spongisporangium articulatum TaxID=3362603 RepID=A0ABW8AT52_9ACTN
MTKRGSFGLHQLHDLISTGGSFTVSTARDLGLTRGVDQYRRETGRLGRPHHGLRTTAEPADLLDRARMAGLLLPPGGAIGRRTAADLMEVDPRLPSERGIDLDVECLVPLGATPLRRPGIRSYVTDLEPDEFDTGLGFPLTTPERTLADLLRWLPAHMALAVADRMARRKLVDLDGVEAILDRWHGHRFVRQARRLLDAVEPKSESYGESWLRLRLLDAGFPRPEAQIPILDGGLEIYRLDLGWPDLRIAVEYDGEEFHGSPEQQQHDADRRRDMFERHRWNVVGVGKAHVLGPTLLLEHGVGEMLGLRPRITHRSW